MWADMSLQRQLETLHNMETFGNRFVQALAYAWKRASEEDSLKLGEAFADLVVKYGSMGPAL